MRMIVDGDVDIEENVGIQGQQLAENDPKQPKQPKMAADGD